MGDVLLVFEADGEMVARTFDAEGRGYGTIDAPEGLEPGEYELDENGEVIA